MNKRKLLIAALAICLAALVAFGTLAYFTDTKTVTNTFLTTSYDPNDPPEDPDPTFAIELTETDIDDPTKTTDSGNTYTSILPGQTLDKDPTAKNIGEHSQFVRVTVVLSEAAAWKTICETYSLTLSDIFVGLSDDWTVDSDSPAFDAAADTYTFVYYLDEALEPGDSSTLFTGVKIPNALNNDDMDSISGFTMGITADAIQSEYLVDADDQAVTDCTEAFKLFDAQEA